jgi:trans-2,3-dihydro-3-hydroxyanthranilate isomerase
MDFYIVDVFGIEKYSGNQLAVVVLKEDITLETKQLIANEFHFSETSFISLSDSEGNKFKVDIFTPKNELPFAGHPSLGTAYIIKNEILKKDPGQIILDLKAGLIPVTFDRNIVWMKQIEPRFREIYNPEEIAPMLGISADEIDGSFPVQCVSTGIEFILVPLKRLETVKKASVNSLKYKEYFLNRKPKEFFIFCPETYEKNNRINCRMFADNFGISEDPATGSANGCLAGYLVKYGYFHENKFHENMINENMINISVEQGFEIGRKSILYLRAVAVDGRIDVEVGGKVFMVASGTLL